LQHCTSDYASETHQSVPATFYRQNLLWTQTASVRLSSMGTTDQCTDVILYDFPIIVLQRIRTWENERLSSFWCRENISLFAFTYVKMTPA
jgi:hypothetical protein